MARYQISTAAADPVRPYLEGVAKSLVDRLYGDKGRPGAPSSAPSKTPSRRFVRCCPRRCSTRRCSGRPTRSEQRPADFQCCPKCGQEVERDPDKDDCRIHANGCGRGGMAGARNVLPQMSAVFFSLRPRVWGLIAREWSPTLQRKIVRAGTKNTSFAKRQRGPAGLPGPEGGPQAGRTRDGADRRGALCRA